MKKVEWQCPICMGDTKAISGGRYDSYGIKTAYRKCQKCGLKWHVEIGTNGIVKGLAAEAREKVKEQSLKSYGISKEDWIKELQQEKPKIKLKQKQKDDTVIINLDKENFETPTMEELQKRLDSILYEF